MNYLLPIETINRELDFKLILAAKLSNGKDRIWIGQHDFLNLITKELEGGVYIGKNIFHKRSSLEKGEIYNFLKSKNIDVVYLHEEGAVFFGNEENWKRKLEHQYNPSFFNNSDRICVWGEFQRDFDLNRSNSTPIISTGHPRFDLYKEDFNWIYKSKSLELIKEHNNYVLINGNYGTANHGLGIAHVFSDKGNYLVDDVKSRLSKVDFFTYSSVQMFEMIKLTHFLAVEYPDVKFVYRPHPSENHDTYKIYFKGINNITINHEGAVGPWILGAKAIIHDGCTTAIEAALSDVPVINYKPHYDANLDIWLPNQMGVQLKNINEVIDYIGLVISGKKSGCNVNNLEKVSNLFENFKSNSFTNFVQVVNELKQGKKNFEQKDLTDSNINSIYLKFELKRKLYNLKNKESRKKMNYHNRKFYGFKNSELESKFQLIQKNLNPDVKFKIHNPFLIEVL